MLRVTRRSCEGLGHKLNNIDLFLLLCHLYHKFPCVSIIKLYVFNLITLGICDGISHSILIQFHADDFFRFVCRDKSNCTDTTVSIHYLLFA